MSGENDYIRPERKYLCDFSVDTRIDDIALPEKICENLLSLNLSISSDMRYSLEVSFGADIYKDKDFYRFPVERKQWQIEKLRSLSPQKMAEQMIDDILSQQLDNICKALSPFHIWYRSATIAGEDIEQINRVDFSIFEDPAPQESETSVKKKGKRKDTTYTVHSVIPHRPSIAKKAAELFAKYALEKAKEESIKQQEKDAHTPNMRSAEEIFIALSTAILSDVPSEHSTPETLAFEMVAHAVVENDWPLKICGYNYFPKERQLDFNSEIDCPDILLFVKRKSYWSLEKTSSLSAAKTTILRNGYNKKDVEQIVVLQNLNPIQFELFTDADGELIPISKKDAHNAKHLLLSWKK